LSIPCNPKKDLTDRQLNFFYLWKECIHSGPTVKLKMIEGKPVQIGYCLKKGRDVDLEYECRDCEDHRTQRLGPQHEKTAIQKARIAQGRKRRTQRDQKLHDYRTGQKVIGDFIESNKGKKGKD